MGDNGLVLQLAYTGPLPTSLPKPQFELPPLILHPIAGCGEALQDGSPSDTETRRAEVRRLELKEVLPRCLGKDLNRWLEQCLEFAAANAALSAVREGDLMDLLVEYPPDSVAAKMQTWGVSDFRRIFARAMGLTAVFPNPPSGEQVRESFVRDFSLYADALYRARRQSVPTGAGTVSLRFRCLRARPASTHGFWNGPGACRVRLILRWRRPFGRRWTCASLPCGTCFFSLSRRAELAPGARSAALGKLTHAPMHVLRKGI